MNLFISYLFSNPEYFFGVALFVIFSICFHELSHAWVALKQGDPTAADRGHLTLNPLRQMGLMSLFMFLFVGLAWGCVPVDHSRMKHRYSAALVAFAGPLANLLLFVVFTTAFAAFILAGHGDTSAATWMLQAAVLNVVLFLLNMMPVPGFDGWGVLSCFFPALERSGSEVVRGSFFVVLMLVFLGIKYFYIAGYFVVAVLAQALVGLGEMAGL